VTRDIRQGDIWLADLGDPVGSVAGYMRPVIIVQGDRINASRLPTYLAVPTTGNMRLAGLVTNIAFKNSESGLPRDSVAQPTLMLAVDEGQLVEKIGGLKARSLEKIFAKLDLILGRA
jgi:mRNA interferase MazF